MAELLQIAGGVAIPALTRRERGWRLKPVRKSRLVEDGLVRQGFCRHTLMKPLFFCSLLVAILIQDGWAAAPDYLREVKPVLAEHCHRCHGASQQKGGLRLDTAAFAGKGGEHGAGYRSGNAPASLLIQVLRGEHPSLPKMPYKKPSLSAAQIQTIARWIDGGAVAPKDEAPERDLHWAFVAPVRRTLPPASNSVISKSVTSERRRNDASLKTAVHPVDAFVRARLAKEGITPSAEADRVTLLRRVHLDLIGLPPGIKEVEAFLADRSPDAFEKVVEQLLASPHYGERWGRWWLDAARYADSNGYSIDAPRSIWKYRDWVIAALNRDMPFDQFTVWQLAGDLIDTNKLASPVEPLIATGFHRNMQINQEGGIDPEQFRVESVMDRVNTTATVWLGVTLGCAQCHDHKFDPFTQRDYYQFYAFFNSTIEDGHGKSAPNGMLEIPGENEGQAELRKELAEVEADLDRYLNTKGSEVAAWEQSLSEAQKTKLKPEVVKALARPFAGRTVKQKRVVYAAFNPEDAGFKQRADKLTRLEKGQARPVTTLVMQELSQPRETHLFTKGDFTRPATKVAPGTPGILHAFAARTNASRLDMARWLVATNNPLTARVIVNRVWQQYFGRGLVETENDFGTQGSLPSHPELLDWLACELMNSLSVRTETSTPWSLKHLHRLIVTSATYRQSSKARPELAEMDPNNKLLARQHRLRLDAEIVRDVCLTASGLLNRKVGGPSVFPPQPDGVMNLGQSRRDWTASTGPDRHRRGMYTYFWRATPHPALTVFDAADGFSACTRRVRSNTPLQALTLLNDDAFHECAEALAMRAVKGGSMSARAKVEHLFRLCLSRSPAADERERLLSLFKREQTRHGETAAWSSVARVLLNLDETISRE